MGIVDNYDFEQLRPFLVSLRRTDYRGKIVLFHQRVAPETLERIRAFGIETVAFRTLPGLFPSGRPARVVARLAKAYNRLKWPFYSRFHHLFLHTSRIRYIVYRDYLARHGGRYRRVLLTDTRDVLFQADPFIDLPEEDILFFAESHPIAVGEWNAMWLRRHLGQPVLDRLASRTTLCAGTTIGRPEALSWYLDSYVRLMRSARAQHLKNGDQSLHNALVYEGLDEMPYSSRTCANGQGAVYTLTCYLDPNEIERAPGGAVLGPSGRPVAVIHQYDRHPEIMRALLHAFAG